MSTQDPMEAAERERDISDAWARAEVRADAAEERVKELESKLETAESKLDRVANLALRLPEGGTGDQILAALGIERC